MIIIRTMKIGTNYKAKHIEKNKNKPKKTNKQ